MYRLLFAFPALSFAAVASIPDILPRDPQVPQPPPRPVSTTGDCGPVNGLTCPTGTCCSKYNYWYVANPSVWYSQQAPPILLHRSHLLDARIDQCRQWLHPRTLRSWLPGSVWRLRHFWSSGRGVWWARQCELSGWVLLQSMGVLVRCPLSPNLILCSAPPSPPPCDGMLNLAMFTFTSAGVVGPLMRVERRSVILTHPSYSGYTDAYCGIGCNKAFGDCKDSPAANVTVTVDGSCGGANGFVCREGFCCSKENYWYVHNAGHTMEESS